MAMQALHLIVCLLFAAVLGEAGITKFTGGGTPDWFAGKFKETWLGWVPASLLWWPIAVAEVAIALLFIAAVATGECWNPAPTPVTEAALVAASGLFAALTMGLRLSQDFAGASAALTYFATSALLALLLGR